MRPGPVRDGIEQIVCESGNQPQLVLLSLSSPSTDDVHDGLRPIPVPCVHSHRPLHCSHERLLGEKVGMDAWDKLFSSIKGLSSSAAFETVSSTLSPILDDLDAGYKDDPPRLPLERARVNALILACDLGQAEVVRWIVDRWEAVSNSARDDPVVLSLLGSPCDASPEEHGGNFPAHHAALAGCVPVLDMLARLLLCTSTQDAARTFVDTKMWARRMDCVRYLGSQTNAHGDTPLMMASVSGHVTFLQEWVYLASEDTEPAVDPCLQKILQVRNASHDSALSLACGHGREDVVQFLLHGDGMKDWESLATFEDVCIARAVLKRLDGIVRSREREGSDQGLTDLIMKRASIQVCLEWVEVSLTRKANNLAAELSLDECRRKNTLPAARKPRSKRRTAKRQVTKDVCVAGASPRSSSIETDEAASVNLTQLADGTRAVVVEGTLEDIPPDVLPMSNETALSKSANQLLRERWHTTHQDSEIDAVMDALCLDVSMLLLTPHGMALHLSPSQLDAVDRILEKQQLAVQQARCIQDRLHGSGSSVQRSL
jgi:hypothetical protein